MQETLKKQWDSAALSKKVGLVVGLSLLMAMLIISLIWAFRDDYQVLFSDLGAQDASAMLSELERLKVPYQLSDGGTTILVARDAVYKTRLKLMGKGLNLQGSVGFEIFNNAEFGMTEFAQKVNYQRALQGELARTIMGFDEIKSARVHLVLPESGLFKRQSAKPKASVSIVMKKYATLSQEQISGIQRLVAASVPEILPTEVTVMDQRGMAVSKQIADDGDESKLHERLDMKKQLEDYMTRKIVTVVDKVVGPGKAIVSVDVALNYDQVKVVKEDVVPLSNTSGQEVGAVTRRRETSQGSDLISGLESIPNKLGNGTTSGTSSADVEYINSRHVEQVLSSPGNILRLNVGVLLPDISDKVKLEKLKEVISMAAGINVNRGDGLAVYGVDFQSDVASAQHPVVMAVPQADVQMQHQGGKSGLVISKVLGYWIFGLIVVIGLFVMLVRRSKNKVDVRLTEEERAKVLDEVLQWAKHASLEGVK